MSDDAPRAEIRDFQVLSPWGPRADPYYWLRDDTRKNPEMLGYLAAENTYADAVLAPTRPKAEALYREIVGHIKQDDASVNVERENDFSLRCLYHEKQFVQRTNAFGSERCGWTNDRMVFQMYMAGGLQVSHLFSLSPDGTQLNVTSTIGSDRVTSPIVISNYYTRFVSQDDHYDCKQTLTRNKVCSQQGHSK